MKKMLLMVAVAMLSACAQMGMQTPDTFNKKVIAAYATVQTVAQSAEAAYQAKVITKRDVDSLVATGRASVAGIMATEEIYLLACPLRPKLETPDPTCPVPAAASAKLASTLAVLTALQSYLAQQGVK